MNAYFGMRNWMAKMQFKIAFMSKFYSASCVLRHVGSYVIA